MIPRDVKKRLVREQQAMHKAWHRYRGRHDIATETASLQAHGIYRSWSLEGRKYLKRWGLKGHVRRRIEREDRMRHNWESWVVERRSGDGDRHEGV